MIVKPDGSGRRLLALLALVVVGAGIVSLSRQACCHKTIEVIPPVTVDQKLEVAKTPEADLDFGPFMARLQRQIKGAWHPPRGQESRHGQVLFKVYRNGSLRNLRMTKSTEVPAADEAMMAAIKNAAPFEHLPIGAPENVDIDFSFDYNVFNNGNHGTYRNF